MSERETSQALMTPGGFSPATRGNSTPEPGATPARPAPQIPDHELLRCIGRGSYGEVWLARGTLGFYRALKVVYRATFDSDRPYEREFDGIRKFEPVSRTHPSQVDILHVGRNDAEGYFYYVMELADDQQTGAVIDPAIYEPKTLRSELKQRGRLPFQECLDIALALTTALDHLHRNGLVHRDVKPSNIIFVNGLPKLADIGLVATVDATCSFVGTEGYLPPEGPGTPQADLYSLGKVLYEISTGKDRRDFPELPVSADGSDDETGTRELNEIILRACENDQRKRYASAAQMHQELLLLQAGRSVRHLRKVERRLAVMTRIGTATAAALVLAAIAYFGAIQQTRRATRLAKLETEQRQRAEALEVRTREALRGAYLAQASANRRSGRPGRRFDSLEAVRKAAEIRPGVDVRNEAIAALTLADARVKLPLRRSGFKFSRTHMLAIDGQFERYAESDDAGHITIRRFSDDALLTRLPGPGVSVHGLKWSQNGRFLAGKYHPAFVDFPNVFRVWDLSSNQPVLSRRNVACNAPAFSQDGRYLAVAFQNDGINLYDLATYQVIRRFEPKSATHSLDFSPDGRLLAVSVVGGSKLLVLDVQTGAAVAKLEHAGSVRQMGWEPTGNWLAVPCADRLIYLWDVRTWRCVATLKGHEAEATYVTFNQKGDLLASAGWDGSLRLWDVARREPVVAHQRICGSGYAIEFSPDDSCLGLAHDDGKLVEIELNAGRECHALAESKSMRSENVAASISPDGRLLACAGREGVGIWELPRRRHLAFLPLGFTKAARFHPTKAHLFTSGPAGLLQWPLASDPASPDTIHVGPSAVFNPASDLEGICFNSNGQVMAVGSSHGEVLVFRGADTNPSVVLFGLANQSGYNISLSPDGRLVAAGNRNGKGVKVWDASNAAVVAELPVEGSAVPEFSPNGKWLVTGNTEGYQFWHVGTWQPAYSFNGSGLGGVAGHTVFSPDGSVVAVLWSRLTGCLLNARTGELLASFDRGRDIPLCFSPDGSQLVTAAEEGLIQIWDLRLIRRQLAAMNLDWDLPPLPTGRDSEPDGNLTIVVRTNRSTLAEEPVRKSPSPARSAKTQILDGGGAITGSNGR